MTVQLESGFTGNPIQYQWDTVNNEYIVDPTREEIEELVRVLHLLPKL